MIPTRAEARHHEQHAKPVFTAVARDGSFLSKRRIELVPPTLSRQQMASTPRLSAVATEDTTSTAAYEASDDEPVAHHHHAQPFTLTWIPLTADLDDRMIEAVCASPSDGRSVHVAFREKEFQLGAIFAALSLPDAQALHRRLTIPATNDPVASAFGRLTKERRDRLLRFLGGARRRAAQERCRR